MEQDKFGNKMLNVVNKLRKGGNGTKIALFTFGSAVSSGLYMGKNSTNEFHKGGLAGIITSLSVEISTHTASTIDTNAKTTHNFNFIKFIKNRSFTKLMNGFQPMVYGGIFSSYFYYSCYKGIKESLKEVLSRLHFNEKSLTSIAFLSAAASASGETVAICMYYPFDLIKSRMQNDEKYKYRNLTDAIYRISKEETNRFKIKNFYGGGGIYMGNYGFYTVLEFTFYETFLAAFVNYSKKKKQSQELEHHNADHAKSRSMFHIVLSAFLSGSVSGFIINPIQYILVNKQVNQKSIRQVLREGTKITDLWTGVQFSMIYYGCYGTIGFVILEKVGEALDGSITEAD